MTASASPVRGANLTTILPSAWGEILLVEDDSARAHRRRIAGIATTSGHPQVVVRLHRISSAGCELLAEQTYRAGALKRRTKDGGKATVALQLLDRVLPRRGRSVVAAGPAYGCNASFLAGLEERGLDYVVEVRPSTRLATANGAASPNGRSTVTALLGDPKWREIALQVPNAATPLEYSAASVADVMLANGRVGRLFAAQTGGILGVHRGTIFGVTSIPRSDVFDLLRAVGWARWIRPSTRREERKSLPGLPIQATSKQAADSRLSGTRLMVRANITLARQQDKRATWQQGELPLHATSGGVLASLAPVLNVAELFAGAGGMGLGFLLAGNAQHRYRLVFSGEVHPIFVETLRRNHDALAAQRAGEPIDLVPERVEPLDLRSPSALALARRASRSHGGLHILIGGPPCQGFSNANRNSWHSSNPYNRLIDVFLHYVEALRPPVFLLENVQGILWTAKGGRSSAASVVEHLSRRMAAAGYEAFPKLLDAVWYGVPQYRSRFFVLGLHKSLGYRREHFGEWGPFPVPTHGPGCSCEYVTVRDAISDLPRIGNGDLTAERPYEEPMATEYRSNSFLEFVRRGAARGVIADHVTSRHAPYVIERYKRIPAGGNWEDIADTLTNYAAVERTHSNIYRRLTWSEPSITIGHYRKSMLVHPSQHRGLSLREATRLQSFPDWFRFAGAATADKTGLVHKQQQLANAVCPLVTKALAEFLLRL